MAAEINRAGPSIVTYPCGNRDCKKPAQQFCSRCKLIYYCNPACQAAAWAAHREACEIFKNPPFGGKTADIKRLLYPSLEKPESILFSDEKGDKIKLSPEAFSKITKKTYSSWWRAPSLDILFSLYQKKNEPEKECNFIGVDSDDSRVNEFEKNPPQLGFKPMGKIGWGVFLDSPVEEGEIISLYTGELVNVSSQNHYSQDPKTHYLLGDFVEANQYMNLAAFINDGAPNCYFSFIRNYKGLSKASCMVALRKIEKGETLFVNYGTFHPVKKINYLIDEDNYKKEVMSKKEDFIISSLSDVFKQKSSDSLYFYQLFHYIFTTIPVFVRSHLEGTFSPEGLLKILEENHSLASQFNLLCDGTSYRDMLRGIIVLNKNKMKNYNSINIYKCYLSLVFLLQLISKNEKFGEEEYHKEYPIVLELFDLLTSPPRVPVQNIFEEQNIFAEIAKLNKAPQLTGKLSPFAKQAVEQFEQQFIVRLLGQFLKP